MGQNFNELLFNHMPRPDSIKFSLVYQAVAQNLRGTKDSQNSKDARIVCMVSAVGMVYLTTEAQNKVLKILAFKKKKKEEKKGPKRRRAQCFGPGDKRKKVNSEVFNPEVATLRKVRPEGVIPRRKYNPRSLIRGRSTKEKR
jgi:hypothetical protein